MKFKYGKDKELILLLNPIMLSLLYGCIIPVAQRIDPDYEITITRTIDEKIPGESVSNSHAEKRAIDTRTYDMSDGMAETLTETLNSVLAKDFGAYSLSDGRPRFAVLEDDHIHFQLRPNLSFDVIYKLITRGLIFSHMNKNVCEF